MKIEGLSQKLSEEALIKYEQVFGRLSENMEEHSLSDFAVGYVLGLGVGICTERKAED